MPEIRVNKSELDRHEWREVGAYKKKNNGDGTYTIWYKEDVEPARLIYKKPRRKVNDDADRQSDEA